MSKIHFVGKTRYEDLTLRLTTLSCNNECPVEGTKAPELDFTSYVRFPVRTHTYYYYRHHHHYYYSQSPISLNEKKNKTTFSTNNLLHI